MTSKISATLDNIANRLEAKGLIKESYELDKIADSIEAGLENMKNGVKYGDLPPKTRFLFDDSTWEKRSDGLGADLVDRSGSISFIGGRRHIQEFKDDCVVFPK
jgi:hypothetical protein